ncbi:MAG: protein kinase, partial [Myxococcales bacterium]|nr:protein kinase [Myxococcales bacterium]
MTDVIDRLVAEGDLARAAQLLETRRQWARAADLYEQLWDFSGAARAALGDGDLPRALANTLRGRDQAALARLFVELEHADRELQLRCAEACEQRGAPIRAAQLYRWAGEDTRAAELYEQAGMRLEAAELYERAGAAKRAMELYRQHLEEMKDSRVAQLALGRLLVRFGQHAEAVPLLQRAVSAEPRRADDEEPSPDIRDANDAAEDDEAKLAAGVALVAALSRLGYPTAAEESLRFLQGIEGAPADVRECLDAPELTPVSEEADQGPVLAGRYRLGKLLGSGGMGRVYRGRDLLHERAVAVKVFTAPGGARGRDAYQRFVREAVATGKLQHAHIVSLIDFNDEMGFVVLEYMAGGSLAERLSGPMAVSTCRSIMLQVLAGLGAAHQRGIVHRDIKPSNIFFTAAGAAKLGDFGVAHLQDSGQTQTGAFIGTLAFMSPEQITGEPITFATDVYALGVTLYLMLTGELPFQPPGLIDKHLYDKPRPPSSRRPELPAICDEVVTRCLAKAPQDRYDALSSLIAGVERFPRELATMQRNAGMRPRAPSGELAAASARAR